MTAILNDVETTKLEKAFSVLLSVLEESDEQPYDYKPTTTQLPTGVIERLLTEAGHSPSRIDTVDAEGTFVTFFDQQGNELIGYFGSPEEGYRITNVEPLTASEPSETPPGGVGEPSSQPPIGDQGASIPSLANRLSKAGYPPTPPQADGESLEPHPEQYVQREATELISARDLRAQALTLSREKLLQVMTRIQKPVREILEKPEAESLLGEGTCARLADIYDDISALLVSLEQQAPQPEDTIAQEAGGASAGGATTTSTGFSPTHGGRDPYVPQQIQSMLVKSLVLLQNMLVEKALTAHFLAKGDFESPSEISMAVPPGTVRVRMPVRRKGIRYVQTYFVDPTTWWEESRARDTHQSRRNALPSGITSAQQRRYEAAVGDVSHEVTYDNKAGTMMIHAQGIRGNLTIHPDGQMVGRGLFQSWTTPISR